MPHSFRQLLSVSGRPVWWSVLLGVALGLACPVRAQVDLGPLRLRGSFGLATQAYAAAGIANRRAPTSAEAFANLSFNLYGLRSGLNLTYSTDQSRLRQNVNRLAFDTRWASGRVAAGDVSPTFSEYSLSGATVRGGYVEWSPGPVLLGVVAGRARRAVDFSEGEGFREPSYRRMLYGGRLGVGEARRTHLHLIGLYGRDLASSIDRAGDLAPVENLTLTADGGLRLLGGRVRLQGEVTASAFTPDTRNDALDAGEAVPAFFDPFFTPREGTSLDYAGGGDLRLALRVVDLLLGYSRVQPGFQSLGVERLRPDQETVRVQPRARLLEGRLVLGGSFSRARNNLADQLLATLTRTQIGLTAQVRLSSSLAVSSSYTRLSNRNTPAATADAERLDLEQVAQTVMLAPVLTLTGGALTHTVSLAGTYQTSADRSLAVERGLRPANTIDNVSATLGYAVQLPSGLSLTAAGNLVCSDAAMSELTVLGANLGGGYTLGALNLSLTGGWSRSDATIHLADGPVPSVSSQLMTALNASYRFPGATTLRLNLRGLRNRPDVGDAFSEGQATLRYEYRF